MNQHSVQPAGRCGAARRLGILTLLLASTVGAQLPQIDATETTRLRLPRPGVRGLSWQGGQLLLLYGSSEGLSGPERSYRASLVRLDPDTGRSETVRQQGDAFETALVQDRDHLWSCGSQVGQTALLYRLDRNTGAVLATFPLPGHHPAGLAFDGTHLWLADSDARKLFRLDIEAAKVSRKVAAPGFYPTGLAFDGSNFWTADASSGRIYRLRGSNARADAVLSPDVFPCADRFVALTWDGQALWAAAADDSFVVRLAPER
jgi:streptogramin lyase